MVLFGASFKKIALKFLYFWKSNQHTYLFGFQTFKIFYNVEYHR